MMKKLMVFLLALCLTVALFTSSVMATDEMSGTCGVGLKWEIIEDGVLRIYGDADGVMDDFEKGEAPWYPHRRYVSSVSMTAGGNIGENAFYDMYNMSRLELPEMLQEMKGNFAGCRSLVEFAFPQGNSYGFHTDENEQMILQNRVDEQGNPVLALKAFVLNPGHHAFIPGGVQVIDSNAFVGDSFLGVALSDSVHTVMPGAFVDCTNMKTVHYNGTQEQWDNIAVMQDSEENGNAVFRNADVHFMTYFAAKEPTCTEQGNFKYYYDAACEEYYLVDKFPAMAYYPIMTKSPVHNWTAGKLVGNEQQFVCEDCGAEKTERLCGAEPALFLLEADMISYDHYRPVEDYRFCSYTTAGVGDWNFYAYFFDGTALIPVSFYQLTSSDDETVMVRFSMAVLDENVINLLCGKEGTATISYTHTDGKTYTLPVTVGVREKTPARDFADVQKDAFYYDAVQWAVSNGVTEGKNATSFAPSETCTRGQVVTFLWRAAGCPKVDSKNPFTDVSEKAYYYEAVLWAVENGITQGKNSTTFGPNDPCTRGHVVTFMHRAEGEERVDKTNPFKDVETGAFYYDAVLWAVENGITEGKNPNTFGPGDPCTRGHVVTFLYRNVK